MKVTVVVALTLILTAVPAKSEDSDLEAELLAALPDTGGDRYEYAMDRDAMANDGVSGQEVPDADKRTLLLGFFTYLLGKESLRRRAIELERKEQALTHLTKLVKADKVEEIMGICRAAINSADGPYGEFTNACRLMINSATGAIGRLGGRAIQEHLDELFQRKSIN